MKAIMVIVLTDCLDLGHVPRDGQAASMHP
jgi:hypothetical protein